MAPRMEAVNDDAEAWPSRPCVAQGDRCVTELRPVPLAPVNKDTFVQEVVVCVSRLTAPVFTSTRISGYGFAGIARLSWTSSRR